MSSAKEETNPENNKGNTEEQEIALNLDNDKNIEELRKLNKIEIEDEDQKKKKKPSCKCDCAIF